MDFPLIIARKLEKLLPESLLQDMTAFALIPKLQRNIDDVDLVVTTKRSEVIEVKDRKILNTVLIDKNVQIKKVTLHKRKNTKYLTYILQGINTVFFVTKEKKDEMILFKKYSDVAGIELEDVKVDGNVRVKLWHIDDALPVILNDEYLAVDSRHEDIEIDENADGLCLLLKEKLAQAKLHTAHSRQVYEEKKILRHELMNLSENIERFDRDGTKQDDVLATDKLKIAESWIRIYNQKMVIGVPVMKATEGCVSSVRLILKSDSFPVFSYSTHTCTEDCSKILPYWTRVSKTTISSFDNLTCLAVFDAPMFNEFAKVTINMALRYTFEEKLLSIPLPDVHISAIDVVNHEFDAILNNERFDSKSFLSIMLSSFNEEFIIHPVDDDSINMEQFLVDKLKFIKRTDTQCNDVFIHGEFPMNLLHGVVLYHREEKNQENKTIYNLHVFTRSENQMLLFVNLIHDQIQARCAVLLKHFTVKTKEQATISPKITDEIMEISEDIVTDSPKDSNLLDLTSLLNQQMAAAVTHLEKCMEVMSERNIISKMNESSINIDVNALGKEKYDELWKFLIEKMDSVKDLLQNIK